MVFLHSRARPIIHRDIKPANVLIKDNWAPGLTDFGSSLVWDGKTRLYSLEDDWGTPLWRAPEVGQGRQYHTAIDIYSTALVFWQVVTGKTPFISDSNVNPNSFSSLERTKVKISVCLSFCPLFVVTLFIEGLSLFLCSNPNNLILVAFK